MLTLASQCSVNKGKLKKLNYLFKWLDPTRFVWISLVLLVISVLSSLSLIDLRMEEPRRALVSLEMLLRDNIVMPTLNGEPYYNKPPVFNWVILFFFKLFGSKAEWIVRLPSVLGYVGMGYVLFVVVRKYVNKNMAVFSTLIFLTSGDIFFYATLHSGEIDLFYSFIVVCQIVSIFVFYEKKQYLKMFLASYFLMVLGILTKGVPSIAFQGITLIALSIYFRDLKVLVRWQHITGILMAFGMLAGYFVWYGKYNDPLPFLIRLFTESSERTVKEGAGFNVLLQGFISFPFLLVSKTLPWSLLIFFPVFFKNGFKKIPSNKLISFFILFIITNIILYWLTPGVKIRYLYMFVPFLLTVVAYYSFPYFEKVYERKWFVAPILVIHILVILLVGIAPFLKITSALLAIKYLSPLLLILSVFNMFYFIRNKQQWYFSFIFLLIMLRFLMNLTYAPIRNEKDPDYRDFIANTIDLSKNEKIYFTGTLRRFPVKVSIGPVDIVKYKGGHYVMPPYIYYKIPFYLSVEKNQVIQYHEKPKKGLLYLASMHDYNLIKDDKKLLLASKSERYVLFRMSGEEQSIN